MTQDREPHEIRADEIRADEISTAKEHVLDAMLGEAAGGAGAPDLTARVLARLHGAVGDPGIVRLPRRRRALAWAAGTLLGAAAVAFLSTRILQPAATPRARLVAWHVIEGGLQWQAADVSPPVVATARAGQRALWPVAIGDRVRTWEDNAAVCDVSSLGRLYMSKGSEIEISAMEWTSFVGGTALGAVTVAVVVGAIRWSGGGDVAQAGTGETLELRGQAPHLTAARVEELTRRVEELQGDLARERTRNQDLEAKASRLRAENVAETSAAVAQSPPPAAALKAAVTYAGLEPALEKVDWDVVGKSMHEMTQKLDELYAALEKGEEMPLAVLGQIQKLNAELIEQAGAVVAAKVPGTGVNGAFTNPVVAANQMYAALDKAGLPLSNAQRDSLQRITAQIAGEDEQRRSSLDAEDFELVDLLGETALKDRFYQEARGLLTPAQERALFPARLAGASANLFDTGLMWAQFAKPIIAKDRTDLAEQIASSVAEGLDLDAATSPQLRAAVDAWAKTLPDDAFHAVGELAGTGLDRLGPVRQAAQRQLELLRSLDRSVPLTAAQKRKLRALGPVFLPSKRK